MNTLQRVELLPSKQRQALKLLLLGSTHEEIADAMGVSLTAVGSSILRTRQRLNCRNTYELFSLFVDQSMLQSINQPNHLVRVMK